MPHTHADGSVTDVNAPVAGPAVAEHEATARTYRDAILARLHGGHDVILIRTGNDEWDTFLTDTAEKWIAEQRAKDGATSAITTYSPSSKPDETNSNS